MERLTRYICDRAHGAQGVSESKLTGAYCRGQFEATAIVERLAAIEDILGDTYDLDHLRELVKADKDGRCAALPCKIGDEVFVLHGVGVTVPFVTSAVVVGLHIRDEKARCGQPRREYLVVRSNGFSKHIPIDKIGITVFLAREAAAAALAKEARP